MCCVQKGAKVDARDESLGDFNSTQAVTLYGEIELTFDEVYVGG